MNMGFSLCLSIVLVSTTVRLSSQRLIYRSFPDNERSVAEGKLCPPLKLDHGRVHCMFRDIEVSCASHMKPKTTATAKCNLYDKRISKLTCLQTGNWDDTLLECYPVSTAVSRFPHTFWRSYFPDYDWPVIEGKLCPPLKLDHGRVQCMFRDIKVSCASHMKPKTTATAECNLNYMPEVLGISKLTCLETGNWDNTLLECYPVCGFSKEDTLLKPQIIDGQVSHVGLFPWHAGVYHRTDSGESEVWEQQCGGSLVTDQFILTGAHCVYEKSVEEVAIALGKHYRSWNRIEATEEKRNVSQIYYPEDFNRATFLFDFSLLLLDKKVKFGANIMPVCHGFEGGYKNIKDKPLFVVGWGKTKNGKSSKQLLYKNVSMLDPNNCKKLMPPLNPNFEKICLETYNSDISVTQKGDSGGGLTVVQDGIHYILGSISFVQSDTLSVFTNISWPYHLGWIQDVIRSHDAQFRWGEHQEITSLILDVSGNSSLDLTKRSCDCGENGGRPYKAKYVPGSPWRRVPWNQARDYCMAEGSQLAIIQSLDDMFKFEEAVRRIFINKVPGSVWIGLKWEEHDGRWGWRWSDGSTLGNFTNWIPGEPASLKKKFYCVESVSVPYLRKHWERGDPYQWNDYDCSKTKFFFCVKYDSKEPSEGCDCDSSGDDDLTQN